MTHIYYPTNYIISTTPSANNLVNGNNYTNYLVYYPLSNNNTLYNGVYHTYRHNNNQTLPYQQTSSRHNNNLNTLIPNNNQYYSSNDNTLYQVGNNQRTIIRVTPGNQNLNKNLEMKNANNNIKYATVTPIAQTHKKILSNQKDIPSNNINHNSNKDKPKIQSKTVVVQNNINIDKNNKNIINPETKVNPNINKENGNIVNNNNNKQKNLIRNTQTPKINNNEITKEANKNNNTTIPIQKPNNINIIQKNTSQNNNNINQNVINQNNKINKEINIKKLNNNQQPNLATVTKISGDIPNKPTPRPISTQFKRRPLGLDDLKNIIYKEVGMINLGNTCFINSCLQVLIHCPYFIFPFFDKNKSFNKDETIISVFFYNICIAIMDTVNTHQKYIDITNFKTIFGTKHPTFEGYTQNDSQEFCRVLLEDISRELNIAKNTGIYRELTNRPDKSKEFRDRMFNENFKARENSIITELFYSQAITTFTCECKSTIYSFQKLLDFPLLLKENIKTIDIIELLRIYFQDEVVDFERECESCKKISKHKKEIKISRPPKILILSLQRIDPVTQKKNECIVTFPKVLNMTEFLDHDLGFDNQPFYDLFAVVNHYGNIESGHYFSYIKFHKREDWYEFNDSVVKKIGNNIESFPYAYALFYIRNDKCIK